MAKYVLAYRGGGMGETPEEQQKQMEEWMNWFGALGDSIVDPGNPFGPSATISSGHRVITGGECALTGYTIISAEDLTDATAKADGCPVLSTGGSVEVYEAMPMG